MAVGVSVMFWFIIIYYCNIKFTEQCIFSCMCYLVNNMNFRMSYKVESRDQETKGIQNIKLNISSFS